MSGVLQFLLTHKEQFSIATGAVGVLKTTYDVIQSRSRPSTIDKLLQRIQGLKAAVEVIRGDPAGAGPNADQTVRKLESQLAAALLKLATLSEGSPGTTPVVPPVAITSQVATEMPAAFGSPRVGFFRRVFLLYRPPSVIAWVPHIICWALELLVPFALFGASIPDKGDQTVSWHVFVQNLRDADLLYALVFFLGVFLLARSWAVRERKLHQPKRPLTATTPKHFPLVTILAILYGLVGFGLLVGTLYGDRGFGRLGAFGLIVVGCGLTVYVWGRLRDGKSFLTKTKAILLFLPTILLVLVAVFDIDGIIVKDFAHDILGYWRSWVDQPAVPALLFSFVALPLYAGIRCLRSVRSLQNLP